MGWVDPPITCDVYEGQTAGRFENDEAVANNSGRTDVEGCCWWGRGVIQTTGVWYVVKLKPKSKLFVLVSFDPHHFCTAISASSITTLGRELQKKDETPLILS